MKLFSLFFEPASSDGLWDWREASLLVIDDINPGFALKDELVTPDLFLHFLSQNGMAEANKKAIREKNIIWILGMDDETQKIKHHKWQAMLIEMGISSSKIFSVNLS